MSNEIGSERLRVGSWNFFLNSQFSILNFVAHVTLFAVAIALYTLTLNGDVQPADSGEFQIAAITLGIPHPPGYPLFTMLGWLFAQIPIGSPYARVSFLSVVASAATLALVSMTVVKALLLKHANGRTRERAVALLAGLAAALALGTSTTFWAQATTTNIRSLTALFAALMLYASARAHATGRASTLVLFAAAFGLGIGHHISLVFIGIALGGYVLVAAWQSDRPAIRRAALGAAIALVMTQLVWLYLPIRDAAGARFAPGNLTTPEGLLSHIFARGFAGDMLAFAAPALLADRLALLPTLLTFQFSAPMLVLMAIAAAALIWQRPALGAAWLTAWATHLFITLTYRAPQTVEYAMPCWVILCVMLGAGLGSIAAGQAHGGRWRLWRILSLASGAALLLALAFAWRDGAQRWPSFAYLAGDRSARASAEAALRTVPPGGAILAQWHQATPMWALQEVEALRRDVTVSYVFPRGAQPYARTFAERAGQSARAQPTFVTSLFADELAARGLRALPLSSRPVWQVAERFQPPEAAQSVLFDERIRVVGPLGADGRTVEVGQAVEMDIGWYSPAAALPGDSITVRILRPDGRLAANADVRLAPNASPGDYHGRRVVLGIPLDLSPGAYPVLVGAYRATESGFVQYRTPDGADFAAVGTLHVTPATWPPATQHPLGDAWGQMPQQPQLIGADYDAGLPGRLRVWTHWRLGRSAIEVGLTDAAGRPLAPARLLSAATEPARPQYLSLAFDIAPTHGIRVATTSQGLPDYRDGQRYIPFANQIVLIGSNAHRTNPSLKVDLHWLTARPLVNDYIISMRIEGDGLYRTHDSVPALGAIPTLKWIGGAQVMDRHPFGLGDYQGALRGSVVVYDSVNRLILPPLDERYEDRVTIPLP
jgi:hypothetical protein